MSFSFCAFSSAARLASASTFERSRASSIYRIGTSCAFVDGRKPL